MPGEICLTNHQKTRSIDLRLLRSITRFLIEEHFSRAQYQLCLNLVSPGEMARVNEQFLNHTGSTDVITFDYTTAGQSDTLAAEIFICIEDALRQSREFRTSWQSELARYLIHGLLHLHGYDDLKPEARRKMKRQEEQVLRLTAQKFRLLGLHKKKKRSP